MNLARDVERLTMLESGIMAASRGTGTEAVLLEDVAGKRKVDPPDHKWILTARRMGIDLGVPSD